MNTLQETVAAALTLEYWWEEIGKIGDANGWSGELIGALRSLISATLKNAITPAAEPDLIDQAKKYLSKGIALGEKLYSIAVVWPETNYDGFARKFFVLVPKYPNGIIKRLDEC